MVDKKAKTCLEIRIKELRIRVEKLPIQIDYSPIL